MEKISIKACKYIEEHFLKGKKGTIVLVSDIERSYYEKLGFSTKNNTHSNGTIMRKIVGEK